MSMEIKALSVDCWIPWKLGPLKARQDPRQKKHLRDGGFEPVHIFITLGWKPKPSASSRKRWNPYCRRAGLANMDKECGRQGPPRKFLPRRNRILPQSAFWRAWLHRTRFPASFLWRGMACRALAGHRTRFPASFLWWRLACRVWAGHRQKIRPRRNRIFGKWLFRWLAVGNTIKTLGFRNVLWESGPWKNFLKVLCPARNLRESGSFGKVSSYKVWPYLIMYTLTRWTERFIISYFL